MTIKSRTPKAEQQALTITTSNYRYSNFTKGYGMRSLSNPENYYHVVLEFQNTKIEPANSNNGWNPKRQLQTEKVHDIEYMVLQATCTMTEPCKGNSHTLCYHSMAAIIKGANLKNCSVKFFDNFSDAYLTSIIDGKLIKVQSTQGKRAYGWIVVTSSLLKTIDEPAEYAVNYPSLTNHLPENEWEYQHL